MNEADMLNIRIGLEGGFDFTWVYRRAPLVLHRDYLRASTARNLRHSCAKYTVDSNDGLVSGFYHIIDTGFHAKRTGSRHRKCHGIISLENIPQHVLQLFHHGDHGGIKMANGSVGTDL